MKNKPDFALIKSPCLIWRAFPPVGIMFPGYKDSVLNQKEFINLGWQDDFEEQIFYKNIYGDLNFDNFLCIFTLI